MNTYNSIEVQFGQGNTQVKISVAVDDDLKPYHKDHNLANFGDITIESIYKNGGPSIFWDNLSFFIDNNIEAITKECVEDFTGNDLYHPLLLFLIKDQLLKLVELGYLHKK